MKRAKKRKRYIPPSERIFHTPEMKRRFADADRWMKENLRRETNLDEIEKKVLEGMIDQMNKTTVQASKAIDDAMAFVDASNKRIDAME